MLSVLVSSVEITWHYASFLKRWSAGKAGTYTMFHLYRQTQTLCLLFWQNEHNINLYTFTLFQQQFWVEGCSCCDWQWRFNNEKKETKNEEEEAKRRGYTVGGEQAMFRWTEQWAWSSGAPFQKEDCRDCQNQTQLRYASVDLCTRTVHAR